MELFIGLLIKLLPLYAYILLGYIVGRTLKVKKDDLAQILIYAILPVVTFHGAYTAPLDNSIWLLPLLMAVVCSIVSISFYFIGGKIWQDNTKNLLAFAASYGNYGYFAVPAAIALFGTAIESTAILAGFGFIIYSYTIGYFISALGSFTWKQSLQKTLKMPTIYAFVLGLILNASQFKLPPVLAGIYPDVMRDFRGVFALCGMMLLGIAISEMLSFKPDWKFTAYAFLAQFIIWPLLVFAVIAFDKNSLHMFSSQTYKVMFLFSLIPIGVNLIAFATQLKLKVETAAVTIMLSTLFAMFYIPIMVALLINSF
jgi:hypothetical protein